MFDKVFDYDLDENISGGTSLQGYVETTFDNLVNIFGDPNVEDGDKTTVEWHLSIMADTEQQGHPTENVVATIYDWKTTTTPMGKYRWHVGGTSPLAVECVQEILDGNQEEF